jgi:hypothetical protein
MAKGAACVREKARVTRPGGSVAAARVGHSGACFASLDGAGRAALAADAQRRLGSPAGGFTLTARAWWARGTAR